ncbi:uncharacterized protein SPAPADRAFT_59080 [Spathaspora passalidarum NRRL Y-27907]|uniref:Uncharacterized protein n=1 Tax=Spathaspora passalidarum (strain NRRL Y-27907 / 11-Y1) TaxID=619300 RepID=G3AIK0_SPAPN|nr:uncharacterized protein SPAPADRAFT_59080 [Spathaspora passalidarum NRRL Y-27907]EGW33714.1 hypothetical protein SPAPADRAFT_59080 [Spathaspora passalidarum NRRL Y-27907]
MSQEDTPTIPVATIARIFRELSFKNDSTRITMDTLELSSEYIKLFINEAIIRSNQERLDEGDSLTKVDGIDNVNQTQPASKDEDDQFGDDDDVDVDFDDDDIPEDAFTNTFNNPSTNANTNDSLHSRHLDKVAGVLVLDF